MGQLLSPAQSFGLLSGALLYAFFAPAIFAFSRAFNNLKEKNQQTKNSKINYRYFSEVFFLSHLIPDT